MKTVRAKTNRIILTFEILIGVVIIAVAMVTILHERKNQKGEEKYESLRQMTVQSQGDTADDMISSNGSYTKTVNILSENEAFKHQRIIPDFKQLSQVNKDIYAWIYVDGTEIDYPVVQRVGDDTYYLNHNIDGSTGYPGCIYSENVNHTDFQDAVSVLYGHNMKNGTMFASLHRFTDKDYFEKHSNIEITTSEKHFTYQIIGAGNHDDSNLFSNGDLSSIEDLKNMVKSFENNGSSMVSEEIMEKLTKEDKFIILSTCNGWNESTRYLVVAVRI